LNRKLLTSKPEQEEQLAEKNINREQFLTPKPTGYW